MTLVEAGIRGGAIALFLLMALHLVRLARCRPDALYGLLLNLGVAAYALQSVPSLSGQRTLVMLPIHFLSYGNQVLFWLFAAAAFDDRYRRSWRWELLWPAVGGFGLFCLYWPWNGGWVVYDTLSLIFVALAIWEALTGRAGDLVDSRRRFRLVLVGVVSVYIVAQVGSSTIFHMTASSRPLSLPNAVVLLGLAAWGGIARLSLTGRGVIEPATEPEPQRPEPPADPQEGALLARLTRLMEDERAYREPGLSVGSLAARLEIPDYRLRRLINGRLGHRNFTSFVNGYRLDEAKAALADPSQAPVPVLTIALDAGFQSIGPFNRAFKADTGLTPSEYRREKAAAT